MGNLNMDTTMSEDKFFKQYLTAQVVAASAHKGQRRRGSDTPYIVHPKRTAKRAEKLFGRCFKRSAIAMLHDVLEDTELTHLDLLNKHIDEEIIYVVTLLTRKPDQDQQEYLNTIKRSTYAIEVKIADMLDNLSDNPTRKQLRKYAAAITELEACL